MGCVYMAENIANGKRYVGVTINSLDDRKSSHLNDVFRGSQLVFHRAIRKYGVESFVWSVLEEDNDPEWLLFAEKCWVKKMQSKLPFGYNMTEGGRGMLGFEMPDNAKEKIRQAVIREWQDPQKRKLRTFSLSGVTLEQLHGKERADVIRQAQSEAQRGKTQSSESNAKRSATLKGRPKSSRAVANMVKAAAVKTEEAKANSLAALLKYNKQRTEDGISEQTRIKLSESHKGKKHSTATRMKMIESQRRRRMLERV